MRRPSEITALMVAILLCFMASGCARWHHRTPEERADRIAAHLVAELGLDELQQQQLEEIKQEVVVQQAKLRSHRTASHEEILRLLRSERIDDAQLAEAVARHQAQADEMIAFFGEKLRKFHDMLTPEQREKAAASLEDFKAHGGHRCGWQ